MPGVGSFYRTTLLSAKLIAHCQSHLVEALNSLKDEEDRRILLEDLQSIDLNEMCGADWTGPG